MQSSSVSLRDLPSSRGTIYTDLTNKDTIRLLRLHPGNFEQEINCNLELVRLDRELPGYEALSYVWCLREGNKTIQCNGHAKDDVTTNLYDALQHLRHPHNSRLLWIDALCINQSDADEKSQQVHKMHQIYTRATRVVVWFGTDDKNQAEGAFMCLQQLNSINNMERINNQNVQVGQDINVEVPKIGFRDALPHLDDPVWYKVMDFFINKWFLRMWVLQEIVLAPSAIVQWGNFHTDWMTVGHALEVIGSEPVLNMVLTSRQMQNAFSMWRLSKSQRNQENATRPFIDLLMIARNFDVTDPKDKIYGLLGFPTRDASLETRINITPDYSLELSEVYSEVALQILHHDQKLDVLSFVVHGEEDLDNTDQPSWMPNWNEEDVIYPFISFHTAYQHQAGTSRPMSMTSSDDRKTLRVRGISVDTVAEVGESVPFEQMVRSTSALKNLLTWCLSKGADVETLSTTLTGGRCVDAKLITDKDQRIADFKALLRDLNMEVLNTTASIYGIEKMGDESRAEEALWKFSCFRAPFVTKTGTLGFGPRSMRAGDKVVILWGGQVPYVLRETKNDQSFRFVGECSLGSLFGNGIVMRLPDKWKLEGQLFEIR